LIGDTSVHIAGGLSNLDGEYSTAILDDGRERKRVDVTRKVRSSGTITYLANLYAKDLLSRAGTGGGIYGRSGLGGATMAIEHPTIYRARRATGLA